MLIDSLKNVKRSISPHAEQVEEQHFDGHKNLKLTNLKSMDDWFVIHYKSGFM